jgi:hypothetical protein
MMSEAAGNEGEGRDPSEPASLTEDVKKAQTAQAPPILAIGVTF